MFNFEIWEDKKERESTGGERRERKVGGEKWKEEEGRRGSEREREEGGEK